MAHGVFERSEERADEVRDGWMEMEMKVFGWNPIRWMKYCMITHLVSAGSSSLLADRTEHVEINRPKKF